MEQESNSPHEITQGEPKKSFIGRFWWAGLIIAILVIAGAVLWNHFGKSNQSSRDKISNPEPTTKDFDTIKTDDQKTDDQSKTKEFGWPSTTAKYITNVPVDLTQIQSISKYRSCAGHDRSGYTFRQVLETNRSMKHYFYPVSAYQGTTDKVKLFAPFDGEVAKLMMDDGKPDKRYKSGNGINLTTSVDPNVQFGFGHIYFVKDFKIGDTVKAGELIGYAALGDKGNDFDIDLSAKDYFGTGESSREVLDSAFDHMTDSVLAKFAQYGITPENTKISKETRDASPCDFASQQDNRTGSGWAELRD